MEQLYDLGIPHPITPYSKLIINAAMTGMIPTKKDNPHVPVSVDQIIEDAVNCYKAGASIVHVHARDNEQKPTYKKEIYAQIIEGIRSQCSDVCHRISIWSVSLPENPTRGASPSWIRGSCLILN